MQQCTENKYQLNITVHITLQSGTCEQAVEQNHNVSASYWGGGGGGFCV